MAVPLSMAVFSAIFQVLFEKVLNTLSMYTHHQYRLVLGEDDQGINQALEKLKDTLIRLRKMVRDDELKIFKHKETRDWYGSVRCDVNEADIILEEAPLVLDSEDRRQKRANNDGVLEQNRITTSEGLELNFAINIAGTYLLTEVMMPLLEKAAPDARVIMVSFGGMYTSPLTKDLQFSESKFDGALQYARNERVQVASTEKWAESYGSKGIGFYSMHPGWAETQGVAKSLPKFSKMLSGNLRTSEEGADTVLWLAMQPKEKLTSGAFYFDRSEATKHLVLAGTSSSHAAIDSIVENLKSMCSLSS